MNLNGEYKLQYVENGASIENVLNKKFIPEGWLSTDVPEDVRTVLRRYGYISGHYYNKNVDSERWIDEKDWIYYKTFYVEQNLKEAIQTLYFEGIDTLAEIYLNGEKIGYCENMHITHMFEVSDKLLYGALNQLVIRILSPNKTIEHIDRTGLFPENDTSRLLIRKSQMNYGWDFCGYCLTTGLWKGVYILSRTKECIQDVYISTEKLEEDVAWMRMQVELSGLGEGYKIIMQLSSNGQVVHEVSGSLTDLSDYTFCLSNPRLWWPRPYGEAHLYQVQVSLFYNGEQVDQKQFAVGIRTVELEQDKLSDGSHSFILIVNGRKIFVRGANWVPINAVYAEITDKEYEYYLSEAVRANLSMLRIWGGGIYESDTFFDLCDQYGIMVFQDFMFACGIYPQDDTFNLLVKQEAVSIIKKYRNRASIVMWSGDNEVDQAYWWYDIQELYDKNKVNRVAIASAIEEMDKTRPYLVSSPCSPIAGEIGCDDPNAPEQGDMHIYLPRFHKESEYFYKKLLEFIPRFMSEYGFSSLPNKDSYEKFNFYRESLDIYRDPRFGEFDVLEKLGNEEEYDRLIEVTQYTHAQGLKYWIEYMRSFKWTCSGSLYWKFNDPIAPNRPNMLFPTLMSSVDFYGKRKLAFYYSKRAYEDQILAFRENQDGGVAIVACNEDQQQYNGNLIVSAWKYQGESKVLIDKDEFIAADESRLLVQYTKENFDEIAEQYDYLKAEFISDKLKLENRYLVVDIGQFIGVTLPQTKLDIKFEWDYEMSTLILQIATEIFAKDIIIDVFGSSLHVEFSDNGFDLDAGLARSIVVTDLDNSKKDVQIRIKSSNSEGYIFNLCDVI